jgi:excinuclease ABC subunit A
VFDTLYAEGQRRYVETFSPYARQFLDRMDKPQVDSVEGIPPAIAIDQTNPVRTSRSTVGTMTGDQRPPEAAVRPRRQALLPAVRAPVRRDTPDSIHAEMAARAAAAGDPRLVITFPVDVPKNFTEEEVTKLLQGQGYTRIHERKGERLEVVQDRVKMSSAEKARVVEAIEAALRVGVGKVSVFVGEDEGATLEWRFSTDLHCADCDIHYSDPTPARFSFNSPIGACDTCRGFGRVIGVDYGLVVPDESKTLAEGAVKIFQSKSYGECQDDLAKYARKRGVAIGHRVARPAARGPPLGDRRRRRLGELEQDRQDPLVRRAALLRLARDQGVQDARARAAVALPRVHAVHAVQRHAPQGRVAAVEGRGPLDPRHDADAGRPPARALRALELPEPLDEATELLLAEIRSRLGYLCQVGLGYLTLDRQSRTLSGGEVQRINLTTALGTSLVNTLFVLDEPSIGCTRATWAA